MMMKNLMIKKERLLCSKTLVMRFKETIHKQTLLLKIFVTKTISGTMVIGLTPVFLFWNTKVPKLSFYLSVCCGLVFGFLLVFGWFPEALKFSTGKYADLLWINVWGILCCMMLYMLPKWIKN
jgi:hypothetical protein